jgi:hypothetical protein
MAASSQLMDDKAIPIISRIEGLPYQQIGNGSVVENATDEIRHSGDGILALVA